MIGINKHMIMNIIIQKNLFFFSAEEKYGQLYC
jgi:hypothetical protein